MTDILELLDEWILQYRICPEKRRLERCRAEIVALREQVARLRRQIFVQEEE